MRIRFCTFAPAAAIADGHSDLASLRYRALLPAAALREAGHDARVLGLEQWATPDDDLAAADAVVLTQPKEGVLLQPAQMQAISALATMAADRLTIDVCDLKLGETFLAQIRQQRGADLAAGCADFYPALLGRAHRIVAASATLADQLRAYLPAASPIVVGDVVEVAPAPVRFAPGDHLKLLWFGFFGAHAAALHRFCADALPLIGQQRNTVLTLLCEPLAPTLLDGLRSKANGVQIDASPWSVPALQVALADCDAVVLPFDHDNDLVRGKSNNRALQALQAGRAVFADPLDSYRELAAFIALTDSLPQAIAAALSDPAAVATRTAAGQAHVAAQCSPAAIAQRWLIALAA
ncbi:MAG: hypothetical protein VW600_07805 [Ferrovibrio sp.]